MTVLDRDQKPMLAKLVHELPEGEFVYEPKWDGFRCLAFRDRDAVDLRSRHGRPLGRYFPELASALAAVAQQRFALDGEVLVLEHDRFDFAALMARLHPAASRVRELAQRTPAIFVAFDLLAVADEDLRGAPFDERRARLVDLLDGVAPPLFATPATCDREVAARWLEQFRGGGLDGVVAKPRAGRYEGGARDAQGQARAQRRLRRGGRARERGRRGGIAAARPLRMSRPASTLAVGEITVGGRRLAIRNLSCTAASTYQPQIGRWAFWTRGR